MELWRLSNHESLDGEGGRRRAARWNTAGTPIVYLAASPPGALLEVLVHLDLYEDEIPTTYKLLRIAVQDKLSVPDLRLSGDGDWKADESLSRRAGDAWLASASSALTRVPSAILPHTFNYLLNPLHSGARNVRVTGTTRFEFDTRLARKGPIR